MSLLRRDQQLFNWSESAAVRLNALLRRHL